MVGTVCLTLGHNSSAVYVNGDHVIGYEEERLTKQKSCSAFPANAIERIIELMPDAPEDINSVYVSHWFDVTDLSAMQNKYFSASKLAAYFPNASVHGVSGRGFSHHDAHAYSADLFHKQYSPAGEQYNLILVVDGFGTKQEVASLSTIGRSNYLVLDRIFGYENSLGLMYQYAAEACGMDGINDVYKFLGYRTRELSQADYALCDEVAERMIERFSQAWLDGGIDTRMPKGMLRNEGDLIDTAALRDAKAMFISSFQPLVDDDVFLSRVRVGYTAQRVLEEVIIDFVEDFFDGADGMDFDNLLVAGGCFYNVRLNDKLRSILPEHMGFTAMPLAGDQGAGIGLAHAVEGVSPAIFRHLYWGKRSLQGQTTATRISSSQAVARIPELIAEGVIVNIMQGHHEFGPRALCNTSTLALPTKALVDAINIANGRTTVMPMAPAMLAHKAQKLFGPDILTRSAGSDQFMITAWDYADPAFAAEHVPGAAHKDLDGSYSGRPQIVDPIHNPTVAAILTRLADEHGVDCVINTSLNIHGQPIVYDLHDLELVQTEWAEKCPVKFETFIIEG